MAENYPESTTGGGFVAEGNFEFISLEKNAFGVARVTLNRPESLNSLSGPLTLELSRAFDLLEKDEKVRSIILTGAGRGFCAGADLKGIEARGGDPADWIREFYNPLILKINQLPKPVICAVNGVAAGAGFSLALACDFRIASERARFISAFIRIGLVPDSGLVYFLPRLVGLGRALEITATGEEVSAAKALEYGMINILAQSDALETETLLLANRLAQGPTLAIGLTKKLLAEGMEKDLSEVLEMEATAQSQAGKSFDFQEGVAAFIGKRTAKFTGK